MPSALWRLQKVYSKRADTTSKQVGQSSNQKCDRRPVDKFADGKWTVDRPATQIDFFPPPPVPFEGARVQRITITDIEAFGTTAGCSGCNAIRSGKGAAAHSDPCRVRIEECLRTTPEGAVREEERKSEVQQES